MKDGVKKKGWEGVTGSYSGLFFPCCGQPRLIGYFSHKHVGARGSAFHGLELLYHCLLDRLCHPKLLFLVQCVSRYRDL